MPPSFPKFLDFLETDKYLTELVNLYNELPKNEINNRKRMGFSDEFLEVFETSFSRYFQERMADDFEERMRERECEDYIERLMSKTEMNLNTAIFTPGFVHYYNAQKASLLSKLEDIVLGDRGLISPRDYYFSVSGPSERKEDQYSQDIDTIISHHQKRTFFSDEVVEDNIKFLKQIEKSFEQKMSNDYFVELTLKSLLEKNDYKFQYFAKKLFIYSNCTSKGGASAQIFTDDTGSSLYEGHIIEISPRLNLKLAYLLTYFELFIAQRNGDQAVNSAGWGQYLNLSFFLWRSKELISRAIDTSQLINPPKEHASDLGGYDQRVFNIRSFVIAHECAHHYLSHFAADLSSSMNVIANSDKLFNNNTINEEQTKEIQADLQALEWVIGNAEKLDGSALYEALYSCLINMTLFSHLTDNCTLGTQTHPSPFFRAKYSISYIFSRSLELSVKEQNDLYNAFIFMFQPAVVLSCYDKTGLGRHYEELLATIDDILLSADPSEDRKNSIKVLHSLVKFFITPLTGKKGNSDWKHFAKQANEKIYELIKIYDQVNEGS